MTGISGCVHDIGRVSFSILGEEARRRLAGNVRDIAGHRPVRRAIRGRGENWGTVFLDPMLGTRTQYLLTDGP